MYCSADELIKDHYMHHRVRMDAQIGLLRSNAS